MSKYNKFLVALGVALGVLGTALSDGTVTPAEAVAVVVAFVGAFGVRQVTNTK